MIMMSPAEVFAMAVEDLMDKRIEGGYVFHPKDPGGETKYGISKRSYPNVDIKNLTKGQAMDIYRRDFWEDWMAIQPLLAPQLLSSSANSGKSQMVRWLQRALGVADDGRFGPISQRAFAHAEPVSLMCRFVSQRLRFFTALSTWPTFGKGWSRRVAQELDFFADRLEGDADGN
jgi:lysozyme family protein